MDTRVKFCGITRIEDAREAVRLGAWAIGLNHWEGSVRRCDPATAVEISAELRRQIEIVGVFVNATLDEVVAAAENETLSILQFHGEEGPSYCDEAARRTGCKVIKAIRVRTPADVQAAKTFRNADFHLLDGYQADAAPGGTGVSFDWELARRRRRKIPMILAGGLNPTNVAEAITVTRPFAVDVASGIESAPGVKDHVVMAAFAEAVAGQVEAVST
jgi:phosphoribosylanthranilate isomerase